MSRQSKAIAKINYFLKATKKKATAYRIDIQWLMFFIDNFVLLSFT
jgi:4-diphosphocytidyl-2C-methyl-D-erythritol kinase